MSAYPNPVLSSLPRFGPAAGIAIGPILFVIGLLGLLAAAIAAGSGAFSGSTTTHGAKALAQSIIQQTDQMATAVQLVQTRNSCADTQISFENTTVSGYTNTNAPADYTCHIFRPDGGGLLWMIPPQGASPSGEYVYTTNNIHSTAKPYIGTNERELVALLRVTQDVAISLQSIVGQSAMPESGGAHNMGKFTGNYGAMQTGTSGINAAGVKLRESGVFCDIGGTCTSNAAYYFYRVLIAR
jgi:type II secretory pathway pseudopilin PulG